MTDSNKVLYYLSGLKSTIMNSNIQISKALPLIDLVSSPPLAKLTREDWALAFLYYYFVKVKVKSKSFLIGLICLVVKFN